MSKKHKKVSTALNYLAKVLILASAITEGVSVSPFASLIGIFIDIASSAAASKAFAVTAGIEKYNSINKKENKEHDEIVLLA